MHQFRVILISLVSGFLAGCVNTTAVTPSSDMSGSAQKKTKLKAVDYDGFFDFQWRPGQGKLILTVHQLESPFIYQSSLARGIGSNDIGLDRGQLGATRLVQFERSGNRLLLVQLNTAYRATSDNPAELRAVQDSFARSVVWGFRVVSEDNGKLEIDITDFLLRDSHDLSQWLNTQNHGSF
ncbi:MAG: DUF5117 domain-containing protein, partial [Pseudomonadota bacterium]